MKTGIRVLKLINHFSVTVILLIGFQNLYGQVPGITDFTPSSGSVGTTITINGTNFNTTAANNLVKFGAVTIPASSATSTQLTVNVPLGASYSPVTVLNTTTKLSAYSSRFFLPTFTPGNVSMDAVDFATKVGLPTGKSPMPHTVCDFDGDGKSDVAASNKEAKTISVVRNTSTVGSISYAPKEDIDIAFISQGIASGDLDGDGKAEIVLANGASSVSILRNTSSVGAISFAAKVDFATATDEGACGLVINDFDGDGRADIALATAGVTISFLRNTTTGGVLSFVKADFRAGARHDAIAMGDFDGDGKPDVVVTNYLAATVSVLRNTSVGNTISFAPGLSVSAVPYARHVAVGDLDGDGKLDIAVPSYDTYGIDLLRNTSTSGNISFAPEVNIRTGGNLFSAAIGDLDGDGKADLVAESTTGAKLNLYKNNSTSGNLSFTNPIEVPVGMGFGLSIADIDNDGKSDLVTSILAGNQITVVKNNPVAATDPIITSFEPASASVGSRVVIHGINFSTTASNIVKFNGIDATVKAVTATSITTTVPTGATTGKITVTISDVTTTSGDNFTVNCSNPAKPTITSESSNDLTSTTLTSSAVPTGGTYQWYRNGTAITGATSQQYTTSDVGAYTVRIDVGGCNATSNPFEIVITSAEQPNAFSDIAVYPNPVTDWLTLSLDKWLGKKSISVYQTTGKLLATHDTVGTEIKIDVANYPAGLYFMKVYTSDGFGILKFVKQ